MTEVPEQRERLRRVTQVIGAALLYAVSLLSPVMPWADGAWLNGWQVLLWAWLGLFDGNIFWLAHPATLAALICAALDKQKTAGYLASAGLLIAVGGLLLAGPLNVGFGFFCWLATLALLATYLLPLSQGTKSNG